MARVAVAIVLFSRTLHAFNMIGSVKSSWQIGHELPASAMSSLEGGEPYCCRKKVDKRNKMKKKKRKKEMVGDNVVLLRFYQTCMMTSFWIREISHKQYLLFVISFVW